MDRPIAWSAVADWADARETGERRALFDWQVWITWRDGTSQRQERVRPMNEGEARCNLTEAPDGPRPLVCGLPEGHSGPHVAISGYDENVLIAP